MSDLVVLGASAAVVLLMIGVAALLGFRKAAHFNRAELERLFALSEPGGRIEECIVAADGRAALARTGAGKLLVAKAMGDGVSLRTYPPSAVRLTLGQARVRATFADLGFPALNMKLDADPPLWLADLAAAQGGAP